MAGAVATYMPVYVADLLVDTMHLSSERFGAYSRLLFHMWRQDGYLPADPAELMALCMVDDDDDWAGIWAGIKRYFIEKDGRITQKRLLLELERSKARREKASANGKRGGRQSKEPDANRPLSGRLTTEQPVANRTLSETEPVANQTLNSSTSTSTSTSTSEDYSSNFLAFWALYPRRTGKGDAWKSWKAAAKAMGNGTILLTACQETLKWQTASHDWLKENGKYVPMPATWLNQRRWEDERPVSAAKSADPLGMDPNWHSHKPLVAFIDD